MAKKSASPVRMCFDVRPPKGQEDYFADLARHEDPTNGIPGMSMAPIEGIIMPLFVAGITAKKWANGRTIRVAFIGGTSAQQQFVAKTAAKWSVYANINFEFGIAAAQSDCRIDFKANEGAYSYIGTDNLGIPKNRKTMNLGWLDEAVVLHEFGHLLFFIHEHQHPTAAIPWNKPAVDKSLSGPPNNWNQETIQNNMYDAYAVGQTQFSAYDKKSIMHYAIDKSWVLDPTFAVGWNNTLSGSDMDYVGKLYPKAVTPPPVDPPPVVGKFSLVLATPEGRNVKMAEVA